MAKTLTDAPVMYFVPFIAVCIVYFAIGLENSAQQFFMAYFIHVTKALTATSTGYFLFSLFENITTVTGLLQVIEMPIMLFGGLLVKMESMPEWLSCIQYISPI